MDSKINEILHEQLKKHDVYLGDEELDIISDAVIKQYIDDQNWGIMLERNKFNDIEKAFSEQWHEDNIIKRHMNQGHGLLQDLFIDRDKFNNRIFHYIITRNDRTIVATVIQWLGTNVGMSFLTRALNRCGYNLVKKQL